MRVAVRDCLLPVENFSFPQVADNLQVCILDELPLKVCHFRSEFTALVHRMDRGEIILARRLVIILTVGRRHMDNPSAVASSHKPGGNHVKCLPINRMVIEDPLILPPLEILPFEMLQHFILAFKD